MTKLRLPYVQTRRDAWVEINLANIEHNFLTLKNYCHKDTKIFAIIKADGYGHGATMIAPQLTALGVNGFGVASVDEGIELRQSGSNVPILVLGSVPSWSFISAVQNDIELSVFTEEHIKSAIQSFEHTKKPVKVHIKIDTGMNRIGLNYKDAPEFINKILNTKEIEICGIFSHLACAEDEEITKMQIERFNFVREQFPQFPAHILNTAGIMSYPDWQFSAMRAGIGIYGLMPDLPKGVKAPDLKPAMSLKGRIAHLKNVAENEGVSYSYTYKTTANTKIATVPIGYADGVSRGLSNKIFGLINGKKVPQIGNITMDQMMFDVSDAGEVNIGDVITLIGEDEGEVITIDEWAKLLNTIHYELTCRLKVRLPRVYTR
ncbi:MAG: alanine racemase [Candidatus Gastranaerophilales bacterium]|nr:alanine racemase [Candidatus Gastranaerophilales bacterium]